MKKVWPSHSFCCILDKNSPNFIPLLLDLQIYSAPLNPEYSVLREDMREWFNAHDWFKQIDLYIPPDFSPKIHIGAPLNLNLFSARGISFILKYFIIKSHQITKLNPWQHFDKTNENNAAHTLFSKRYNQAITLYNDYNKQQNNEYLFGVPNLSKGYQSAEYSMDTQSKIGSLNATLFQDMKKNGVIKVKQEPIHTKDEKNTQDKKNAKN